MHDIGMMTIIILSEIIVDASVIQLSYVSFNAPMSSCTSTQ